ncbi:hypothetical protein ACJX0J_029208, partial [Zea mays]
EGLFWSEDKEVDELYNLVQGFMHNQMLVWALWFSSMSIGFEELTFGVVILAWILLYQRLLNTFSSTLYEFNIIAANCYAVECGLDHNLENFFRLYVYDALEEMTRVFTCQDRAIEIGAAEPIYMKILGLSGALFLELSRSVLVAVNIACILNKHKNTLYKIHPRTPHAYCVMKIIIDNERGNKNHKNNEKPIKKLDETL